MVILSGCSPCCPTCYNGRGIAVPDSVEITVDDVPEQYCLLRNKSAVGVGGPLIIFYQPPIPGGVFSLSPTFPAGTDLSTLPGGKATYEYKKTNAFVMSASVAVDFTNRKYSLAAGVATGPRVVYGNPYGIAESDLESWVKSDAWPVKKDGTEGCWHFMTTANSSYYQQATLVINEECVYSVSPPNRSRSFTNYTPGLPWRGWNGPFWDESYQFNAFSTQPPTGEYLPLVAEVWFGFGDYYVAGDNVSFPFKDPQARPIYYYKLNLAVRFVSAIFGGVAYPWFI